MFARMLLVFLLVLNLGTLAWWLLHRPDTAAPAPEESAVPKLWLLQETPPASMYDPPVRDAQMPAANAAPLPSALDGETPQPAQPGQMP